MIEKLLSISRFSFIMVFTSLAILVMFLLLVLVQLSGIDFPEKDNEQITIRLILLAVFVAPIIETYIFQKLPIDFFKNNFEKDWPLVLISAIPFGIMHYLSYNMYRDILYATCIGTVYAYAYLVAQKREDINPYFAVVLIHAGYNLIALILHLIFE